jgi:hypothetical protein
MITAEEGEVVRAAKPGVGINDATPLGSPVPRATVAKVSPLMPEMSPGVPKALDTRNLPVWKASANLGSVISLDELRETCPHGALEL